MDSFDIKCPNCGTMANLEGQSYSSFLCKVCSSEYILRDQLCPHCFTYADDARTSCANCGSALSQICSRCGRANWPGHERCYNCGNSLDIMELITERHGPDSTVRRLESQMQQAKILKTIEDVESQKRMSELETIESLRKARIEQRQNDQSKRDRRLLLFSGVLFLAFVLALLVYGLLQITS